MNKSDQKIDSVGAERAVPADRPEGQSRDAGQEFARLIGGIGVAPDFTAFGERMNQILRELQELPVRCDSCDWHHGTDS